MTIKHRRKNEVGLKNLLKIHQFSLSLVLQLFMKVLQVLCDLFKAVKFHATAAQDRAVNTEENATGAQHSRLEMLQGSHRALKIQANDTSQGDRGLKQLKTGTI